MARPKKQTQPIEQPKSESEKASPRILTQSEHQKLSPKEKQEFRAKNGTVSNQ